MKKLAVVLMSLHLILSPVALANGAPSCNSESKPESGMARIKEQVKTLAISSVGANILLSCTLGFNQPSLPVFAAGSVVHIAAEIFAGKKLNQDQQQSLEDIEAFKESMTEGGDLQKESIESMLKNENRNLDIVKKRLKWLKTVQTIYKLASVLALIELLREITSMGTWSSLAGCGPLGTAFGLTTSRAIIAAYTIQNFKSGGSVVGGLLQSLLFLFVPIHGSLVPVLYNHAGARIATFGVTSFILVGDTIKGLEKVKETTECRIAKLEYLLSSFKSNSQSENELNEGSSGERTEVEKTDPKKFDLKKLPPGIKPVNICAGSKGATVGDSCTTKVELKRPVFDANFKVPTLQSATNTATDLANAMAGGDIARAEVLGDGLLNSAGRIRQIEKDLKKQINEKLKEQGKSPIDFDKEFNERATSLVESFNEAAKKANLGTQSSAEASALGDDLKGSTSLKGENAPVINPAVNIGEAPTNGPIFSESVSGEEANGIDGAAPNDKNLEESLEEFESNESDISKESSVSIFKQLSNRYFLNYTKIFKRKEIDPPLSEEPQN